MPVCACASASSTDEDLDHVGELKSLSANILPSHGVCHALKVLHYELRSFNGQGMQIKKKVKISRSKIMQLG